MRSIVISNIFGFALEFARSFFVSVETILLSQTERSRHYTVSVYYCYTQLYERHGTFLHC
ncbi:MAG: hypothetical protein ACFBSE_21990 [Prochloraceae cyanobacterium]